jgi:glutathione S-transferase
MIRIIGSYLSPYVRKVLVTLELKGLPYEIDPIVPFMGDERFAALSPLRRVPVYQDERVTLTDSSVICQYLEDAHPAPALYPADIVERAQARWYEEYADTRLADLLIWGLFNEALIAPAVWGRAPDREKVARVRDVELPVELAYLEARVPFEGCLFGSLSIADVAIGAYFGSAAYARYRIDAERFPRTAAYVDRVLAHDVFARLQPFEALLARTPIPAQRAALAAAGAPLTGATYGTDRPTPGVPRGG